VLAGAARQYAILTDSQREGHAIIKRWAALETAGKMRDKSEEELKAEFLTQVFGKVLGFTLFSEGLDHWELRSRYPLPNGQEADGAIGLFGQGGSGTPVAVIEFKGPKANLDRDKSQGRTAVRQCWDYLDEVPECPWGIVCNYVSFRLYHRNQTPNSYQLFTLQELREEHRFAEFLTLFDRHGLLAGVLGQKPRALRMLHESQDRQRVVGKELYQHYHRNRQELIVQLWKGPDAKSLDDSIKIVQKLLDRIIFIAFCEDRELLPPDSIGKTWREVGAFTVAQNPRWQNFLNLFRSIDRGNERFSIPPFNGGLFAHDDALDGLNLDDRWTNFFKAIGSYDFRDEVNVDVLGHLFEQSITDLEALKADPQRLEKPTQVSGRRKSEGIYYTPKHITRHIVEQTLGPCINERFAAIAASHGVDPSVDPVKGNLKNWVACHNGMLESLKGLRVCDPACGSGAFLIQAYEYLEDRYADVICELAQHGGQDETALAAQAKQSILHDNLFGVDLSPEAVKIAQLALWIRTAERGKTLENLSENIRCGNSIVDAPEVDPNAFIWASEFHRVFEGGGFDCMIGNPPYVKLQNFRKRHPGIAACLSSRYRSARTGNFDMYLPFIERGLELLKEGGRLGFIAPSVWIFNEYGRGLRELVLEQKSLDRFVDFKSFQVFDDATNYTALQFFTKARCEAITVTDAPDGEPTGHDEHAVAFEGLSSGAWALSSPATAEIIETMKSRSIPLQEACGGIIVGIQTSADDIYHLKRLGPGRYYSKSLQEAVEIEDEIMKPLVSGEEAVPFAVPPTDKYLLFPYEVTASGCRLYAAKEMGKRFRRAWNYLERNEQPLRHREGGKMDHERWYAYNYPKNLDKQELPKLGLPQTVSHLSAFCDPNGERYFNNVRVNGVLARADAGFSLWYLLAVLNSKATDFFFRQTAKPKDREYFEANKQFIAPLPIPDVKPQKQKPVASIARKLADLHGKRLEATAKVRNRIIVDLMPSALVQASPLSPKLSRKLEAFADIPIAEALKELGTFAKRSLRPAERDQWDTYVKQESNAIAKINRLIADLTSELNERVNALYGLSEAQVKVIGGDAS
jgi:type I restriction-modification system DNA methylase subunit